MAPKTTFSKTTTQVELDAVTCCLATLHALADRLAALAENMLETPAAPEDSGGIAEKQLVGGFESLDEAALATSVRP